MYSPEDDFLPSPQRFCVRKQQFNLTCKQIATLTLHPKVVLTARADRPRSLKSLEKDWVRVMRGLSSATTMQVRTQDRFTPFICEGGTQHTLWLQRQQFQRETGSFVQQNGFESTRVRHGYRVAATQSLSILSWKPLKMSFSHRAGLARDLLAPSTAQFRCPRHHQLLSMWMWTWSNWLWARISFGEEIPGNSLFHWNKIFFLSLLTAHNTTTFLWRSCHTFPVEVLGSWVTTAVGMLLLL